MNLKQENQRQIAFALSQLRFEGDTFRLNSRPQLLSRRNEVSPNIVQGPRKSSFNIVFQCRILLAEIEQYPGEGHSYTFHVSIFAVVDIALTALEASLFREDCSLRTPLWLKSILQYLRAYFLK